MTFILLIWVFCDSPSLTQIPGFKSRASCEAAAVHVEEFIPSRGYDRLKTYCLEQP